ncbi:MAG TPA: bifunctional riboflavin kinase/FMN adenylyltransferase [Dehalococcoidia bacterium]|nr:bifunctional riboflavin kinase/FAD synthetase [SAR202 cluster bacterium]HBD82861.1 bifunctional riboflavin kinase/FMN adenylyltransferase [Dehalococcoidia bacterium]HBJ30388.1 bifunctional riboflavin kinase/FMN adenylyltransferase [Dehalococcoidia bacterium]HIM17624.1 bifunctional riboflavin kinase/FAD synthetase [Dehalococcoidia bacterium]
MLRDLPLTLFRPHASINPAHPTARVSMKIDEDLSQLSVERDSALTIGVFDGVHRGHVHLIRRLISEAKSAGMLSGVVTFRNHPKTVLRPDFKTNYISDLDERIRLLKEHGIDFVVPVTFDRDLAQLSSERFLDKLSSQLRMKSLIVGPDFAMGHKRDGTLETIPLLGEKLGFTFKSVDLLKDRDDPVKSTVIRNLIAEGSVESVSQMLGRNFSATGTVVDGLKRGRTLGFPTANLEIPNGYAAPGDGIYATWAYLESGRYMAATSIGTRPTFTEGGRTIEAYLLDFSDDIYGQTLRLEFVKRLREEEKFDGVDALLAQINKDVQQTRDLLTTDSV